MITRPTTSTRTDKLVPYTTLFRSDLAVGGDQLGQHVVEDRLVDEDAARAGAALAGGADRAEHDRRDRQLQVGGFVDDHRVVAAQLQQRASHALGDALADVAADLGRAGEADQRSEEHTSELQSLMRLSYAVFCLKKK